MANLVSETLVTHASLAAPPLDADKETGATADFLGIVRASEDGRRIDGIDYEAHQQMAEHQLKHIGVEASQQFGLNRVLIHHRIGFVAVGEPSLFVRVCAAHRREAFEACRWIVEELKGKVPIWKRPRFKAAVVAPTSPGEVAPEPGSPIPATV